MDVLTLKKTNYRENTVLPLRDFFNPTRNWLKRFFCLLKNRHGNRWGPYLAYSKEIEAAAVGRCPARGQVEDERHLPALQLVVVAEQVVRSSVLRIEQRQLFVQLYARHLVSGNGNVWQMMANQITASVNFGVWTMEGRTVTSFKISRSREGQKSGQSEIR